MLLELKPNKEHLLLFSRLQFIYMKNRSAHLGTAPIPKLLLEQAVPASIGILVMSIYGIVDTIFVGRFIGALGIGAITVVWPITLLISSIGMAIGIGGASIISRALGADNEDKAQRTFGNQVVLTLVLAISAMLLCSFYIEDVLILYGAKGDLLPYAIEYFQIIIYGIPFLAFAMMSNNVIRSEGAARVAMFTMITPAVLNIVLDPILIIYFEMGMRGAAWATTIGYIGSAGFAIWYFASGRSELRLTRQNLRLDFPIVKEIFSLGGVTLARQGTISVLYIILNNTLYAYGGELSISIYGIITRFMMIANFPVLGVTQGFLPIAGFNYGAEKWGRVRETIRIAILSGTGLAILLFAIIMIFTPSLVSVFTTDEDLLQQSTPALRASFLAMPLICVQLIGSAYFQAIGKALPALLLTLSKQGFFLIPLILILPNYWGIYGVWFAFPIADVLAAVVTFLFLRRAMRKL